MSAKPYLMPCFALMVAIAIAGSAAAQQQRFEGRVLDEKGKALKGVDRGLTALATAHHRSLGETADPTPTRNLFRIGATLHPELRPPQTLANLEAKEDADVGFDWNVLDEWLSEADQTLGSDGRLRR